MTGYKLFWFTLCLKLSILNTLATFYRTLLFIPRDSIKDSEKLDSSWRMTIFKMAYTTILAHISIHSLKSYPQTFQSHSLVNSVTPRVFWMTTPGNFGLNLPRKCSEYWLELTLWHGGDSLATLEITKLYILKNNYHFTIQCPNVSRKFSRTSFLLLHNKLHIVTILLGRMVLYKSDISSKINEQVYFH